MQKQIKYHHSVTENGNIQVRQVTEYTKSGKLPIQKFSNPMTPADTKDMTGWDNRSKDIVSAIIDPTVLSTFATEKSGIIIDGDTYTHPDNITDVGIEETVSFDREIKPACEISVRRISRVFDEGIEISKKYHRSWIMPGDDPSTGDIMSKALSEKLHTPAIIATYKNKKAEQEAKAKWE